MFRNPTFYHPNGKLASLEVEFSLENVKYIYFNVVVFLGKVASDGRSGFFQTIELFSESRIVTRKLLVELLSVASYSKGEDILFLVMLYYLDWVPCIDPVNQANLRYLLRIHIFCPETHAGLVRHAPELSLPCGLSPWPIPSWRRIFLLLPTREASGEGEISSLGTTVVYIKEELALITLVFYTQLILHCNLDLVPIQEDTRQKLRRCPASSCSCLPFQCPASLSALFPQDHARMAVQDPVAEALHTRRKRRGIADLVHEPIGHCQGLNRRVE
mmetsp:Transcript_7877/g.15754  ORF Transcript_7877/g.15754 Transcript_7877/m.15754 type:complete len:273 (+) Transcript_7877:3652-4470(+)